MTERYTVTTDRKPMDVTIGYGKDSLARFMRAVILYDCQVTATHMNPSYHSAPSGHDDVYMRVQIPPVHIDAFRDDVMPREMREPPRVDVGRTCAATTG